MECQVCNTRAGPDRFTKHRTETAIRPKFGPVCDLCWKFAMGVRFATVAKCQCCFADLTYILDDGFPPGYGQFRGDCPKCGRTTWFDKEN